MRLEARVPMAHPVVRPAAAHFFFGADSHDGFALLDRFVRQANSARPDLVLGGGDFTEKGTPEEDQVFRHIVGKLDVPFVAIAGNHDARGRGLDAFKRDYGASDRAFDVNGVHVVLLDDQDQTLSEASFAFLERDLAANHGKPTVVAMHVPPVYPDPPKGMRFLRGLGEALAYPKLVDPAQARRFTDLMTRFKVKLVLSGHTHKAFEQTVGGVRYVVAGAVGGKIFKGAHEYLDVKLDRGRISVEHVPLDKPRGPLRGALSMGAYYSREKHLIRTVREQGVDALGRDFPFRFGDLVTRLQRGVARVVDWVFRLPVVGRWIERLFGKFTRPRTNTPEVGNMGRLGDRLLRGAQPTQQGYETLKRMGVRTVINLRPEAEWDRSMVEQAGLDYVYLPVSNMGEPTLADGLKFLSVATDPANGTVFFHCQHGADRTGAMAAIYRIVAQGWSLDRALGEMTDHGFHAGFQDAKVDFVRQFVETWNRLAPQQRAATLHRQVRLADLIPASAQGSSAPGGIEGRGGVVA